MSIVLPCGVTLTVEAAFSAATGSYGVWNTSLWDGATFGPDAIYQDISAYLRRFKTDRAFSRDIRTWESGNASVQLTNRDRRFSPANLTGSYASSGVTGIRPWRPFRARATYAGVVYPLYTGYTRTYAEAFEKAHADSTVTVGCVDELAHLAQFDGLAVTPVGAGETTGARIHRVLSNAGHTGNRSIMAGRNTVQATALDSNAAQELKLVTDSEGGGLFIDADGTVVFEDQAALIEQSRSNTIQATFSDGSGTELECADVEVEYNGDDVRNIVSYTRVGGTAQTASDATSRALYGDLRSTRSDLICQTDAQALALATFDMSRFKDPELRVARIVIRPQADPTKLWPQVLGRRVRDLIRVVVRPIGGGTITRDCHIAGIHHDTDGAQWTTTFDLWSASFYQAFASARWDFGTWDGSTTSWYF